MIAKRQKEFRINSICLNFAKITISHLRCKIMTLAVSLMLCESFGWSLDEIMQMNVDKLKARYPEGFDIERANHRAEGDV